MEVSNTTSNVMYGTYYFFQFSLKGFESHIFYDYILLLIGKCTFKF